MEPETIDPARVQELHEQRARAEQANQSAPPVERVEPAAAVTAEPMTMDEHAGLILELANGLSEVGGRKPDGRRLGAVIFLTYPAGKRWGRSVENVPPWLAIVLALAGVGLLAVECGVVGNRGQAEPAPQQQGGQHVGRG